MVYEKAKPSPLLDAWCKASMVRCTIQVGVYLQAGLRLGGADELEDLLVTGQRLTRPVFRDFRKQPVLHRIPFGSSGGIVGHGNSKVKTIAELFLDFCFPRVTAAGVTTARVGQDQETARPGIAA